MLSLLLFALAQAAPPPADAPAAPPAVEAPADPTPGVLTWEELPATLRAAAEKMVGRPSFQSVLMVEPAAADAAPRTAPYGAIVLRQTVRPAEAVKLAASPNGREKYGRPGELLWAADAHDGRWWCRRDAARLPAANAYCLRDADGDGRFDTLYENNTASYLSATAFQLFDLGKDEGLRAPVAYERSGTVPPYRETLALRYAGPVMGEVTDDGRVVRGLAAFEVLILADASAAPPKPGLLFTPVSGAGWSRVRTFTVELDEQGRGERKEQNGLHLIVERVDVGGDARLQVVSALRDGPNALNAVLSRESVLETLSQFLGPDGKPRDR